MLYCTVGVEDAARKMYASTILSNKDITPTEGLEIAYLMAHSPIVSLYFEMMVLLPYSFGEEVFSSNITPELSRGNYYPTLPLNLLAFIFRNFSS